MHIAFVVGDPGVPVFGPSAASNHVRSMVLAFTSLGHRVTVLSTRLSPPRGRQYTPLPASITTVEVPPKNVFYPLRRWPALREVRHNPRFFSRAVDHLCADRPDLVYERFALFCDVGLRLSKRFGVPHILEVNAPLAIERARFHGLRLPGLGRRWEAKIVTGASLCVPVSSPLATHLLDQGVDSSAIHVEANGVDTKLFSPVGSVDPVWNLPSEGPRVVFAGGFRPWHGLEHLLQTLDAIYQRAPEMSAVFVGDGPETPAFQAAVNAEGWGPRAVFLGQVPPTRIPAVLRGADMTIIPTPPDGFDYFCPLKLIEAMACGLPVLAHGRGDVPSLLGVNGASPAGVSVGSPHPVDWGKAAMSLWANEALREEMAEAGRLFAMDRDWRAIATRVLARAFHPDR